MSSFTIGKKLFLGVGTLVVFAFALGIASVLIISGISDRMHTVVGMTVKKQTLAHAMRLDSSELVANARGIEVRPQGPSRWRIVSRRRALRNRSRRVCRFAAFRSFIPPIRPWWRRC